MQELIEQFKEFFSLSALNILVMVVIVVAGFYALRKLLLLLKFSLISSRLDNSLVNFVLTAVKIVVYTLFVLHCMSMMGIAVTGFVSAISAVTLAIGLSIQNVIASVANGLMIVSTRPFKVNDFVDIDGISGTVQEVTLMHTILNTPDNKHVFVPNSKVFGSQITNYSTNDLRRLDVLYDVDYESDVEQVRKILLDYALSHPLVLKNPAPAVHYAASKDSSITFTLRVWVKNSDYWPVNWDLQEENFKNLVKGGVTIPFPQVTLSYRSDDKEAGK